MLDRFIYFNVRRDETPIGDMDQFTQEPTFFGDAYGHHQLDSRKSWLMNARPKPSILTRIVWRISRMLRRRLHLRSAADFDES